MKTGDLMVIRETIRDRWPSQANLQRYIHKFTGRVIPGVSVCDGHNSPLEFLTDLLYGQSDIIAMANRTGGKTATTGIGVGMLAYHLGVSSKILGGSSEQGDRLYGETKWWLDHGYEKRVSGDVLKSGVSFSNGAWISLMTQSTKSARGPHPPLCVYDELDEFDYEVFEAGKSIPKTDPNIEYPAKMAMLSTRHYAGGIMAREWAEDREGRNRFIWCVWEVMQPCNQDQGYSCSTCPLQTGGCPGHERMSKSQGYLTFRDVLQAYRRLSTDAWESEWCCKQPRTSGLVYPTFDVMLHTEPNLTYYPGIPLWRSCDYGVDNETVILYWQVDGSGCANCLQELRWTGVAPSVVVQEMIEFERLKDWQTFNGTIVDPSALGFRKELEREGERHHEMKGLKFTLPANNDVEGGIAEMRNAFVVQSNGRGKIMYDRSRCKRTIEELAGYRMLNGRPVKKEDHGADASRYFVFTCPDYQRTGVDGGIKVLGQLW